MADEKAVVITQTIPKAEQLTIIKDKLQETEQRVHTLQETERDRKRKTEQRLSRAQNLLQHAINLAISTEGQIKELESRLAEQKRDRYRLEGILETLQKNG